MDVIAELAALESRADALIKRLKRFERSQKQREKQQQQRQRENVVYLNRRKNGLRTNICTSEY